MYGCCGRLKQRSVEGVKIIRKGNKTLGRCEDLFRHGWNPTLIVTEIGQTLPAVITRTAGNRRIHGDLLADTESLYVPSHFDNFPTEFVATISSFGASLMTTVVPLRPVRKTYPLAAIGEA